ncbi:trace amine-associated receptor 9-like [Diadema antillarum]|uniref:trace amine-associated receptor 9-like n=1 Tax=Diadema antillarum TaxID=105358 RepID=UPI003A8B29FF
MEFNATSLPDEHVDSTLIGTPLHRSLMTVAFTPLAIVIVIGNALVMLAIRREPTLREQGNLLIACLSLADFLTGLVAIPVEVFRRLVRISHATCTQATVVYFTMWPYVFTGVSSGVIVLVNVDRYVAITRPLRYVSMVTTRRVVNVIVWMWVGCLTYGFMFAYGASEDQSVVEYCAAEPNRRSSRKVHRLFTSAFIVVFSLVVIASNLRILSIAKSQARRIQMAAPHPPMGIPPPGPKLKQEVKAIRAILLLVIIFCVSLFPTCVWFTVEYFFDVSRLAFVLTNDISFFFLNISSAANPFIYSTKNPFFRKAFRKMFPSFFKWLAGNKVNVDLEENNHNLY